MALNIRLRGKLWSLKRRVPERYREVESRAVIWESLKTDSRSIALQKAERVWAAYLEGWEAKLAGRDGDAMAQFKAARNLAQMRGFAYLSAAKVAELPLEEILTRFEAINTKDGVLDPDEAKAFLGGVEDPGLMLSGLVARVEEISRLENRFKSDQQMRLWRNPLLRTVTHLRAAIGQDVPVTEIGSAEARAHRRFLKERITSGAITTSTANKDFSHMSGMLRRVYDDLELADAPRPYAGVTIQDRHEKPARKAEVPLNIIRDKWLAVGAFDGLNDEARDILLISLETGSRQSELTELPAGAFRLDDPVPHFLIANEDGANGNRREIKNLHSERRVPLVGLALAAARRHPEGFPRYRNSRSYSATVNKYLREHDLVPHGVTVGGTRHTWESRLKAVGIATDDRGEIMGHSVGGRRGREVYGDEMTLEVRRDIVASIAFPVPDHLA